MRGQMNNFPISTSKVERPNDKYTTKRSYKKPNKKIRIALQNQGENKKEEETEKVK